MKGTSTKVCHYIVLTPVATKIFVCERDAEIFSLKQKGKEISPKTNYICSTSTSFIIPQVLNHQDLKQFTDAEKFIKKSTVRKGQGCKDEEWKCKLKGHVNPKSVPIFPELS